MSTAPSRWAELRTVALVGTERRPLPAGEDSLLPSLPDGLSPEEQALHTAALLSAARRTGNRADLRQPPANADGAAHVSLAETPAPAGAVQLLALMVQGNAGPGDTAAPLFALWFELCRDGGYVIPHHLLVPVLDMATTTRERRTLAQPVLGQRGRWLASQRDSWKWASTAAGPADAIGADLDAADAIDIEALLEMTGEHRDATITAMRASDPTAGRDLIVEACSRLDAASRAKVLACLAEQLSDADDEVLEGALDDRSKAVRAVAVDLLNRLPTSERAKRLARQLEPLIANSGRSRPTITVTFPDAPNDEQLRDVSPHRTHRVIEHRWFDTLIIGAPLSLWEETLGMDPTAIVKAKHRPDDELLAAWVDAALAQKNHAWATALLARTRDPALLPLVGVEEAAAAFLGAVSHDAPSTQCAGILDAVPGPWTRDFSRRVVKWIRSEKATTANLTRLTRVHDALARNLASDVQPELEAWLSQLRTDENQHGQRLIRNVIQQLSFRTSIIEAFS